MGRQRQRPSPPPTGERGYLQAVGLGTETAAETKDSAAPFRALTRSSQGAAPAGRPLTVAVAAVTVTPTPR